MGGGGDDWAKSSQKWYPTSLAKTEKAQYMTPQTSIPNLKLEIWESHFLAMGSA